MWRKIGKAPDYRFTLANERTFLAWIRTALAFLAAAIYIDQLAPNIAHEIHREILTLILSFISATISIYSYRRWASNEKAMRQEVDIEYTRALPIISIVMLMVVVFIIYLIFNYKK